MGYLTIQPYLSTSITIMKDHNILNVQQLINFNTFTLIHKLKHNIIRNNMNLQTFRNQHDYETRRRNDFIVPRTRGNILYDSSLAKGLSQFNQLPSAVKNETNMKEFKKKLRSFLINLSIPL